MSDLKVSEMSWQVKKFIIGQTEHGLLGSNVKT